MGDGVDNLNFHFHFQPKTKLFEMKVNRHFGQKKIDSSSIVVDEETWTSLAKAARSSLTDIEFFNICNSLLPVWSKENLTAENFYLVPGLREAIFRIINLGLR